MATAQAEARAVRSPAMQLPLHLVRRVSDRPNLGLQAVEKFAKRKLRRIANVIRQLLHRYPIVKWALTPLLFPRRVALKTLVSRAALERNIRTLFAEPPLLRVPEFRGEFRVASTSDTFLRLLTRGKYEPILADVFCRLSDRNRDVVDVGANVGFFAVLAANVTRGRVLAIEPTERALSMLKMNLEHNGVSDRVSVFEGAASDKAGEAPLNYLSGKEEYSSVGPLAHPSATGGASRVYVPTDTVDHLAHRYSIEPGLIKIDVEGFEYSVLSGALEILSNFRPVVLCEFSPRLLNANNVDQADVLGIFREREYHLIDPVMPGVALGKRPFGDLLAVPKERYSEEEVLDLVRLAGNVG